jgi:hypothetical protein
MGGFLCFFGLKHCRNVRPFFYVKSGNNSPVFLGNIVPVLTGITKGLFQFVNGRSLKGNDITGVHNITVKDFGIGIVLDYTDITLILHHVSLPRFPKIVGLRPPPKARKRISISFQEIFEGTGFVKMSLRVLVSPEFICLIVPSRGTTVNGW